MSLSFLPGLQRSLLQTAVLAAFLAVSPLVHGATVIVTQTDDVSAGETPVFGSLRDAIANRASPGDTIVFDVRGAVELQDLLTIPRHLPGLRIQGPVRLRPGRGLRGVIAVEADDTAFDNMTFVGVSILANDTSGGVPRRIRGFALERSRMRGDVEVFVSEVDNCRVSDNHFNVSPRSGGDWALSSDRTGNCVVSGNRIISRSDAAYRDRSSSDLQFVGNTVVKGSVRIAAISGEVLDNGLNGRLFVNRPDFGAENFLLSIHNNTIASVFAERTFVTLTQNTLKGSSAGRRGPLPALFLENGDPRGPQGPVLIENNTISGGLNGISYTEASTAAPAVVNDNEISGCRRLGILVNAGRDVQVTNNRISACGSDLSGRGIAIGRAAGNGVLIENNTVSGIDGDGIVVVPQRDGNEVALRGNTVTGNAAYGLRLLGGDGTHNGNTRAEDNILRENDLGGVRAGRNARGTVFGGNISDNNGAGISVQPGATVEIRQVAMGGNTGAGIDIAPEGVTDNDAVKDGNADIDWPENLAINPASLKLDGRALPGSIIEVFVVESGERLGNPENGEGSTFLGETTASAAGTFEFPAAGTLACPASRLITLTATTPGDSPVTSEFSPDFDCVLPDDPPPVDDDDADGVPNNVDQCDATPAGESVDADGCAESQKDDDQDGVTNDADQCELTPADETADATGCSDSQLDDDGDGVNNRDDVCPGAGSPEFSGCGAVVVIPGLGTVYLNNLATSTIATGAQGEACSDCLVELDDATSHSCFGNADLTITGPASVSSAECEYAAPGLSIQGSAAVITSAVTEGVACEGAANACTVESVNASLAGNCGPMACVKWFSESLLNGEAAEATRVTLTKSTVGGDDTFVLVGRTTDAQYPYFWSVSTNSGAGDKLAELHFGTEAGLVVEEVTQPEWSESVLCTNETSGEQVAGADSALLSAVPAEAFTTWHCEFVNTLIADSDGDGVPDSEDRCSNPGTGGNECPEQGDNGEIAYYCNEPLSCGFIDTAGDCNDCTIERLDGYGSISCEPDEVCVLRDTNVLECQSGGCSYDAPGLTGQCGLGTLCTFDIGFSCATDVNGNGCEGTFSSGDALGCPVGEVCQIEVTPNLLVREASQAATVDFRKATQGGDGVFTFEWLFSSTVLFAPGFAMDEGQFTIETQNGVGQSVARFYIDPFISFLNVYEEDAPPFVFDRIECATTAGLRITPEDELPPGISNELYVENDNDCTYVNVREAAQPDRVEPIPDGKINPDGVSNVHPAAFGGQLDTDNPVVAIGTGNGQIFIDTVTGAVPRAGNERLAFPWTGVPTFGVVVQPSAGLPGFDTVRSTGPGTVAYPFDPATGTFGFGLLGFDLITDLVHLGNDNTAAALLSVNQTRNRIDVLAPPPDSGIVGREFFPVIESQNMLDATGPVVSAQFFDLGRLDCYNPCQQSGLPMPSGCSAEIDQVLATTGFEFCADAWTPSCAGEYSNQNGAFCSLPAAQRQVNFGGNVLVLTDGTPGQVHVVNPALDFFGRARTIGNAGDAPRSLRCLAGVCAASNHGSSSLTILTWDGAENAQIVATVPVGSGPVGLDLRQDGDNVVILSTGSNDNTYSMTTVSSAGQVLGSETAAIPAGCEGPAHITWIDGSSRAFATCFDSDAYAVFTP